MSGSWDVKIQILAPSLYKIHIIIFCSGGFEQNRGLSNWIHFYPKSIISLVILWTVVATELLTWLLYRKYRQGLETTTNANTQSTTILKQISKQKFYTTGIVLFLVGIVLCFAHIMLIFNNGYISTNSSIDLTQIMYCLGLSQRIQWTGSYWTKPNLCWNKVNTNSIYVLKALNDCICV